MKKVLIVLSISAFFAACNGNSTKSSDVTKDSTSTTVTIDSSKMAPATADTTMKMTKDSSHMTMKTDSTIKK